MGNIPASYVRLPEGYQLVKACLDILTDRKVGTKDKATVFQEMVVFCLFGSDFWFIRS